MSLISDRARRVHVRAPGKINLFFEVGPVGDDGYHDVASVYQAVSLFEDVWASHADEFGISVSGDVDVSGVPLDDRNLAMRAARLVTDAVGWEGGIRLEIHKGVPVAGGMGGGSADAAAALVAVNDLVDGGLTAADLHALGAQLGADVPFALLGGTAVGTGRGDELAPALGRGRFAWVLVADGGGLSTPEVYGTLDRLRSEADIAPDRATPSVDPAVLRALRSGDAAALAAAIRNDLQLAAVHLRPDLAATLDAGLAAGALGGIISGSGPTIALLAEDASHAARVADRLTGEGHVAHAVTGPVAGARSV
ncbi:4-(cytidine 5'-diphospho)-2-C-methyl-D-erythritol kinase [Microbacterium sp. EYE_5]|uniref:4-(cytidine 5'-diphospho)-2-C-methyl-D-erythritol kinase n=1 Tax=unclassified Microbacterium TaxID=2609290 RepID=UPI00200590FB|nr:MULTISPECIES: 4-(cytidine 5'-diphospho)-2-C-methyl-D-erythritol kinase [unclassified Microbacterium]MCK6081140.1 4-(cytidine 5'-diphospho)-2-C-methyl-D-erythritol kinase [Microbacterium sp. EYE_382]MCK6086410.1 4-(cytidine 5'-diphospho)-2-C-methyl-D-erythritol kinase [Microbacterium sp. EYE_384]MCK6124092.1 4-(cytidine 5'-diphospho)-2-C-methyl-D-erythritol kinase [Microbacterium sp. EYE_80]MCK6127001.1 4-(cytidine 5'-diphospho)-2-C-methyl-D-erythritol kinase [Microbacterium sp. EYE_79]MCK61